MQQERWEKAIKCIDKTSHKKLRADGWWQMTQDRRDILWWMRLGNGITRPIIACQMVLVRGLLQLRRRPRYRRTASIEKELYQLCYWSRRTRLDDPKLSLESWGTLQTSLILSGKYESNMFESFVSWGRGLCDPFRCYWYSPLHWIISTGRMTKCVELTSRGMSAFTLSRSVLKAWAWVGAVHGYIHLLEGSTIHILEELLREVLSISWRETNLRTSSSLGVFCHLLISL